MSRYPPHPSYYYYHHQWAKHARGRWFGLSHLVFLGVGLWAGSSWTRRHDYHYPTNYWGCHRVLETPKKPADLPSNN